MHYKKKRTAKEKSGDFFLDDELLEALDFIARFERQSRSAIVEFCLNLANVEGEKNEKVFEKYKRKYYKKKIFAKKKHTQTYQKKLQTAECKSLFSDEFEKSRDDFSTAKSLLSSGA